MHIYHATFQYLPRFCRHPPPLPLDSWANASTRWHVLTQGVLMPKFCSDFRETETFSSETAWTLVNDRQGY
jgi:hypothetical protein